jgi:serine protease AprX
VILPGARCASRSGFSYPRVVLAAALGCGAVSLALSALSTTPVDGDGTDRTAGSKLLLLQRTPKVSQWVIDRTANGRKAEFLVVLADQADLTEARRGRNKHERRRRVRDALWNKAQQTQQPILQWLRQHNVQHRPFYIVNAIWVKTDAGTAATLAARPDVLRVEGNPQVRNPVDPILSPSAPASTDQTAATEQGVFYSHAPDVWSLGYTGQGVVIAGADTGYRWTHSALKDQYRGWNGLTANHDYNWHDSIHPDSSPGATPIGGVCGTDSAMPCDDNNHGTHTMGTAVGDDGGTNEIGMAPGAKWIGCRNMDQTKGTPARYMECMEFFLAPYPVGGTPAQGDPDLAPDISTNSWSCPTKEGCSPDTLQAAVEAQRAAGILMVAAAGNDGSNCHTISDPPGIYDAVYTIGALNNGTDVAASFSSRGSVTSDNSDRRKPDLAAPGTNVRSSTATSDTSYGTLSGTSMAAPHVAGAIALLWSAEPSLRNDVDATEVILNESAEPIASTDCGSSGVPNNTYGYGRLDVKAAVDTAFLIDSTRTSVAGDVNATTVTFYAGKGRT